MSSSSRTFRRDADDVRRGLRVSEGLRAPVPTKPTTPPTSSEKCVRAVFARLPLSTVCVRAVFARLPLSTVPSIDSETVRAVFARLSNWLLAPWPKLTSGPMVSSSAAATVASRGDRAVGGACERSQLAAAATAAVLLAVLLTPLAAPEAGAVALAVAATAVVPRGGMDAVVGVPRGIGAVVGIGAVTGVPRGGDSLVGCSESAAAWAAVVAVVAVCAAGACRCGWAP